ncbi:conserved protein of unknown function [Pseudomonas putida KT2440]|uniref:Uncharacterized protein n=1 Tax=Pseudomonas putida (strain ATCC 47054 / DSM 6125 / CFBP 8728 / NCIMB 11950 / KT2440) TaxID=160488 RepID=Q88FV0_PSEPK|nr:conserved protein of unknown function [Pseudomonas putida KT2440]
MCHPWCSHKRNIDGSSYELHRHTKHDPAASCHEAALMEHLHRGFKTGSIPTVGYMA